MAKAVTPKAKLSVMPNALTEAQFKALNADFDTTTATGELMLTVLGAIATFERALMLDRQRDGIEKAKREGKYKGRKSESLPRAKEIMDLLTQGNSRSWVAENMKISIATVYRVQRKMRGV